MAFRDNNYLKDQLEDISVADIIDASNLHPRSTKRWKTLNVANWDSANSRPRNIGLEALRGYQHAHVRARQQEGGRIIPDDGSPQPPAVGQTPSDAKPRENVALSKFRDANTWSIGVRLKNEYWVAPAYASDNGAIKVRLIGGSGGPMKVSLVWNFQGAGTGAGGAMPPALGDPDADIVWGGGTTNVDLETYTKVTITDPTNVGTVINLGGPQASYLNTYILRFNDAGTISTGKTWKEDSFSSRCYLTVSHASYQHYSGWEGRMYHPARFPSSVAAWENFSMNGQGEYSDELFIHHPGNDLAW